MNVENFESFHYLLLELSYQARELEIIKDFENCISEYNEICGCAAETKQIKSDECEEKYKNIVLNHIDLLKPFLRHHYDEYNFFTSTPEKTLIATLNF